MSCCTLQDLPHSTLGCGFDGVLVTTTSAGMRLFTNILRYVGSSFMLEGILEAVGCLTVKGS